MTLFGKVKVTRWGYSGRGTSSVFPLEEKLNLPGDGYSYGIHERVGEAVARSAFDVAVKEIDRHTGGHVPKRQAEELSRKLAIDFNRFYEEKSEKVVSPDALLVISTDGKGIPMRVDDLRPVTRKAAQSENHKLKTRLSKGEKRFRKRMALVAAVYDVKPHQRKADEIMALDQSQRKPAPKPFNKRVWASIEEETKTVLDQAFEEAKRHDPGRERQWLILVDGLEEQLRQVNQAMKRHGAEKAVVIQDFIHVLEYVWKAARCLYPEGSTRAEIWVCHHALSILEGKLDRVITGMCCNAEHLSEKEREPIDKCVDYLLKNKERMNYALALEKGWPIATGVIEGACRYLVKDRMECTGARWSLAGAEAVLRLRALQASNDWDAYMIFHLQQERIRNRYSMPLDEKMAA